MFLRRFFCVLSFFFSSATFAYPVAFECGADRSLRFPENEETLRAAAVAYPAKELLAGIRACEQDTRATYALILGTSAAPVAFPAIDEAAPAETLFLRLQECHRGKREIDAENGHANYRLPRQKSDDFGIHIFYPRDNLFSLIAGVRKEKDHSLFKPVSLKDLQWVIRDSLAYGIDPYLMIAIGVSEQASEINHLEKGSHDYHLKQAIGCGLGENAHRVVEDPGLEGALRRVFVNHLGRDPAAQATYACVSRAGRATQLNHLYGLEIFAEGTGDPTRFACCLRVPFELPARKIDYSEVRFGDRGFVDRVLNYRFIEQNLAQVGTDGKTELDDAIESYLIRSSMTGSIAGHLIAPFRLGLNSHRDPNYGRTNIDYVLNSLLVHPVITKLVEELNPEAKPVPSALCQGREPGVFVVDTDETNRKTMAARRMGPIHDLWANQVKKKGLQLAFSTNEYHRRALAVFMFETRAPAVQALMIEKMAQAYYRMDELLYRHALSFYRELFDLETTSVSKEPLTVEEQTELETLLASGMSAYFDQGIFEKRRTFGKAAKMDMRGVYSWERKTVADALAERRAVLANEAKYGRKYRSSAK
jgi:hypothetical protein